MKPSNQKGTPCTVNACAVDMNGKAGLTIRQRAHAANRITGENLIRINNSKKRKIKMTNTENMLDYLQCVGWLLGNPKEVNKKIPHQTKMVLLRKFNDWRETNDKHYEDKFLDYWLPIRKFLDQQPKERDEK
jgi:hypothetical protein